MTTEIIKIISEADDILDIYHKDLIKVRTDLFKLEKDLQGVSQSIEQLSTY